MYWRRVSKLQRSVLVVLVYVSVYLLISYALSPNATVTFAEEGFSVGKKYVFMFLSGPKTGIFKDSESVEFFEKCGKCFLTNNRGFMPIKEYDAVLVFGDGVFDEPNVGQEKKYVVQTTNECSARRLRKCAIEPVVVSYNSRQYYDLCSLCRHLHLKRNDN